MEKFDYIVIGGGLAGDHAEAIRENDPLGSIDIITDENHLPYDRVPLSKTYLTGNMPEDALYIKKSDFYEKQQITIIKDRKAVPLDPKNHIVKLNDGLECSFKKLLLSTEGHARHLLFPVLIWRIFSILGQSKIQRQSKNDAGIQECDCNWRRIHRL